MSTVEFKDISELLGSLLPSEIVSVLYPQRYIASRQRGIVIFLCEECVNCHIDDCTKCHCNRYFCKHFPLHVDSTYYFGRECLNCILGRPHNKVKIHNYYLDHCFQKLAEKISSQQKEIDNLKLELHYRPDGLGAVEAKTHFTALAKIHESPS